MRNPNRISASESRLTPIDLTNQALEAVLLKPWRPTPACSDRPLVRQKRPLLALYRLHGREAWCVHAADSAVETGTHHEGLSC